MDRGVEYARRFGRPWSGTKVTEADISLDVALSIQSVEFAKDS